MAQYLVERELCKLQVMGSSPITSTMFYIIILLILLNIFLYFFIFRPWFKHKYVTKVFEKIYCDKFGCSGPSKISFKDFQRLFFSKKWFLRRNVSTTSFFAAETTTENIITSDKINVDGVIINETVFYFNPIDFLRFKKFIRNVANSAIQNPDKFDNILFQRKFNGVEVSL